MSEGGIPNAVSSEVHWALIIALRALEEIAAGRHGQDATTEAFATRALSAVVGAVERAMAEEGGR